MIRSAIRGNWYPTCGIRGVLLRIKCIYLCYWSH